MIEANDPVILMTCEAARNNPFVTRVRLFGSRARGDNTPRSDYDMAFYTQQDTDLSSFFAQLIDKNPSLKKMDLIHYRNAKPEIQESIDREGVDLYEAKENRESTEGI